MNETVIATGRCPEDQTGNAADFEVGRPGPWDSSKPSAYGGKTDRRGSVKNVIRQSGEDKDWATSNWRSKAERPSHGSHREIDMIPWDVYSRRRQPAGTDDGLSISPPVIPPHRRPDQRDTQGWPGLSIDRC